MSRFRQEKYIDTLKEPRKRDFITQKEKKLWKFRWHKGTSIVIAWLLAYLLGFFFIIFLSVKLEIDSDKLILPLLGWAFFFPVPLGVFFQLKTEKAENRDPLSTNEFIEGSASLKKIEKIYIRAIRYVLGFVYKIEAEIIYPNDTPEILTPLNKSSNSPLAFEVVLGTSIRLQIPLSDEEVDRIIENIRPSRNVEELTCIFAQELEAKGKLPSDFGDPNREILDLEEDTIKPTNYKKRLLFSLFGGLVFMIWYPFTIYWKKDEPLSVFTTLHFLAAFCLGFGFGWLSHWAMNLQSKKKPRSSDDDQDINLEELAELADNSPARKYINCCFLDLASYPQGHKYTFYESDPFPPIPGYDNKKMPSFISVCSKLKKSADMKDCFYRTPQKARTPLVIKEVPYDGIIEICDGIDEAYFSLQLEPSDTRLQDGHK